MPEGKRNAMMLVCPVSITRCADHQCCLHLHVHQHLLRCHWERKQARAFVKGLARWPSSLIAIAAAKEALCQSCQYVFHLCRPRGGRRVTYISLGLPVVVIILRRDPRRTAVYELATARWVSGGCDSADGASRGRVSAISRTRGWV